MKIKAAIIPLAALVLFAPACGDSEAADADEEILKELDDADLEQAAEDAAAEIDETNADQALEDLEKELSDDG